MSPLLSGIACHFEKIEASMVIKGVILLNGHLFVVAMSSGLGFWETEYMEVKAFSVPHTCGGH